MINQKEMPAIVLDIDDTAVYFNKYEDQDTLVYYYKTSYVHYIMFEDGCYAVIQDIDSIDKFLINNEHINFDSLNAMQEDDNEEPFVNGYLNILGGSTTALPFPSNKIFDLNELSGFYSNTYIEFEIPFYDNVMFKALFVKSVSPYFNFNGSKARLIKDFRGLGPQFYYDFKKWILISSFFTAGFSTIEVRYENETENFLERNPLGTYLGVSLTVPSNTFFGVKSSFSWGTIFTREMVLSETGFSFGLVFNFGLLFKKLDSDD